MLLCLGARWSDYEEVVEDVHHAFDAQFVEGYPLYCGREPFEDRARYRAAHGEGRIVVKLALPGHPQQVVLCGVHWDDPEG